MIGDSSWKSFFEFFDLIFDEFYYYVHYTNHSRSCIDGLAAAEESHDFSLVILSFFLPYNSQ